MMFSTSALEHMLQAASVCSRYCASGVLHYELGACDIRRWWIVGWCYRAPCDPVAAKARHVETISQEEADVAYK